MPARPKPKLEALKLRDLDHFAEQGGVSKRWIWNKTEDGTLPYYKVAGRRLIDEEDWEAMIRSSRRGGVVES